MGILSAVVESECDFIRSQADSLNHASNDFSERAAVLINVPRYADPNEIERTCEALCVPKEFFTD